MLSPQVLSMPSPPGSPHCPRASVTAGDPTVVAESLARTLGPGPFAAVLVFASPTVDRERVASEFRRRFQDTLILGCTTAGEIGPDGLVDGTVSATGLPSSHFRVAAEPILDFARHGLLESRELVSRLVTRLAASGTRPSARDTFALLVVDGLAGVEERLASSLDSALGEIPLVGGSAGDGVRFERTHVFFDGKAHQHAAVVALVQTSLPFEVFKTQHFRPGDLRLVVTSADPARRLVHELDGEPAARWLAGSLGVSERDLGPTVFAKHPVVVRIGGADYVRSIQKVEPDGSLKFYCAIEEGVVLRAATGDGLVENLQRAMTGLRSRVGEPCLTIAFDCILRGLECRRDGIVEAVSAAMRSSSCTGFSTYGEQFRGIHVNQTLTGVVVGNGGVC